MRKTISIILPIVYKPTQSKIIITYFIVFHFPTNATARRGENWRSDTFTTSIEIKFNEYLQRLAFKRFRFEKFLILFFELVVYIMVAIGCLLSLFFATVS